MGISQKNLGKGSRTARKGKERVGLKLNGKGSGEMLPERIHTGEQSPFFWRVALADEEKESRTRRVEKKFWGGGKYQDFPKPGRTRRGGGFSNQRKNSGGRRRRGAARTAGKSEGGGGKIGPERGKAQGKTRAPERPARTGGRKKILKRRRPRKEGKLRPRFRFNTIGEKRRERGRTGHVKKS